MKSTVIIGGGASGFFCAINLAEKDPSRSVTILEKTNNLLGKVKVSGGGRCNVTHFCFDPKELVKHYPRGRKELLSAFYSFQPRDTVEWFENRGVALKTEEDGRMFPVSDDSQTIVDCFITAAEQSGVNVRVKEGVHKLERDGDKWSVHTSVASYIADEVVLCSGSSPKIVEMLKSLGQKIVPAVPSLFTFNVKDSALHKLSGLSIEDVEISLLGKKAKSRGPMLVTHWGLSAPSVLKLSAAEAVYLHEVDYQFEMSIDFMPETNYEEVKEILHYTQRSSVKNIQNFNPFGFPKRFWVLSFGKAGVPIDRIWPELRKQEKKSIITRLKFMHFNVQGKSTFKEEFVTAGGVDLKDVDFKTMESKSLDDIYFGGEVLNIDGFTGGFNFQAAWTTAFIASNSISKKV